MHLIKLACTFVQHHNQSNQAFFYTDFIRLYGSGFKSGSTTLDPTTAYLHLYFGEKICCFFLHIFFWG